MSASQLEEIGAVIRRRLRTPLSGVIAQIEALLAKAKSAQLSYCLSDLERIHAAGLRLSAMLDETGDPTARNPAETLRAVPGTHMPAAPLLKRPFPPYGSEPAALLVIDDNETNRDILSRYLLRYGHRVTTANGGIEALIWQNEGDQTRETLTIAGGVAGTPAYIAPERLLSHPYDGRSDVYSRPEGE